MSSKRLRASLLGVAWCMVVGLSIGAWAQERRDVEPLQEARSQKPNIVLIYADDLGWKDVGYQGAIFYETPCIDRLAREGMVFTDAYASAGNCAPSRACLLTGYYTPRHAVYAVGDTNRGPQDLMKLRPVPNELPLKSRFITIAEGLKQAGYATGQFGKWHLGSAASGTGPEDQGFDVTMDVQQRNNNQTEDPKGVDQITDQALAFIAEHRETPFFCYVAHHAIHTPLQARPETLQRFRAKQQGETRHSPLYAACLYDLDAAVGRLVDEIDRMGLSDNTIIIFTSDNGATPQSSQEPLRGAKGAYYEAGIRVPLLVRWTGHVQAKTTCSTPVIQIDLFPTCLALAGVEQEQRLATDPPLDGADLMPLLKQQRWSDERSIYWHFPGYLDRPVPRGRDPMFRTRPVTVVRRGDWKLLLYHEEWLLAGGRERVAENGAVELYDLRQDPGEHHNLVATEPEARDRLLDDVLAWIDRAEAPLAQVQAE